MINRTTTKEENFLAFMCHLSPIIPLLIIFIVTANGMISDDWLHVLLFSRLIFPIVGWMIGAGEKSPWIVHHAKNALNFQITYSFLFYIPFIIASIMFDSVASGVGDTSDIEPLDGFALGLVLMPIAVLFVGVEGIMLLIHVILVFIASMIALNGIKNVEQESPLIYPKTYPLVIPFFRTAKNFR